MTQEQIKTVLRGIEETLRMIASLTEYQKLQNSEYFTTSNDLTLGDAIQSVSEVYEGILEVQYQEEIAANQARSEAQLDLTQNHPWS
ncbi:hypothetical protein Cylst_6398 (plasmid) [Cylindrospermum stagnale PCC 7417]|uniref:Uncharacterized protein n=1 Tax=Cylindrospermum stagnale PCC 7417 TaxID=56107 RepID=K9X988_9NOST|nr:hypothetical protein [Cylindrospermum stagnale]AFZ28616.1 hypothetical protein Cylst_6398 [Cylindrospermum stagnale PCC 7417]